MDRSRSLARSSELALAEAVAHQRFVFVINVLAECLFDLRAVQVGLGKPFQAVLKIGMALQRGRHLNDAALAHQLQVIAVRKAACGDGLGLGYDGKRGQIFKHGLFAPFCYA